MLCLSAVSVAPLLPQSTGESSQLTALPPHISPANLPWGWSCVCCHHRVTVSYRLVWCWVLLVYDDNQDRSIWTNCGMKLHLNGLMWRKSMKLKFWNYRKYWDSLWKLYFETGEDGPRLAVSMLTIVKEHPAVFRCSRIDTQQIFLSAWYKQQELTFYLLSGASSEPFAALRLMRPTLYHRRLTPDECWHSVISSSIMQHHNWNWKDSVILSAPVWHRCLCRCQPQTPESLVESLTRPRCFVHLWTKWCLLSNTNYISMYESWLCDTPGSYTWTLNAISHTHAQFRAAITGLLIFCRRQQWSEVPSS